MIVRLRRAHGLSIINIISRKSTELQLSRERPVGVASLKAKVLGGLLYRYQLSGGEEAGTMIECRSLPFRT